MSITFKRYLYLSLYLDKALKSARCISHVSSIFVTVRGFREKILRAGLCKVSCPDSHASAFFSLLLALRTHFATELNPAVCLEA
jgi:hypothetical protein